MDSNNTDNTHPENTFSKKRPFYVNGFFLGGAAVVILAVVLFLLWNKSTGFQNLLKGSPTPTILPFTSTPTEQPSEQPSPTMTATMVPMPTNTPMPRSAYYTTDLFSIDPLPPALAQDVVVLDEETSVIPSPEFIHPQWYGSETIAEQLGALITEHFYATIGNGSATWQMDVPLEPGLYEIFIMDTAYSSAGTLDFSVMLGSQILTPLLGDTHVDYLTTNGGIHSQTYDMWHSLGVYSLDNNIDLLSVSTSWDARENSTIVGIDRALVARIPQSIREQINMLPVNSPRYVVDDLDADLDSNDTWLSRSDKPAWGDKFQMLVNPGSDTSVIWEIPDLVDPGLYEIMIWSPQVEGHAEALFKVLVDGSQFQGAMAVDLGSLPGDHWVSLGSWDTSAAASTPIELAVKMEIAGGTIGEVAVDTIVFIRR